MRIQLIQIQPRAYAVQGERSEAKRLCASILGKIFSCWLPIASCLRAYNLTLLCSFWLFRFTIYWLVYVMW